MSEALTKRPPGSVVNGLIPAGASAIIPGAGQLINGEFNKAIGVFLVALIAGSSLIGWIPLIGGVAGLVGTLTWIYGVADGYLTGRKKRG